MARPTRSTSPPSRQAWTEALLAPGATAALAARIRRVLPMLPPAALLLDVGCGTISRLTRGVDHRVRSENDDGSVRSRGDDHGARGVRVERGDPGPGSSGRRVVGVELAAARAVAFRRGGGAAVGGSATRLPFTAGAFDAAWCFGLLHHLDDGAAAAAVREMCRVTRAGGLVVVFDSVWPEPAWRRPVAWMVRRLDRGRWVRRQADLTALLPAPAEWACERFGYARTGLEGLWCTTRVRGAAW